MSAKITGVPLPQIMYGFALERIEGLENGFRAAGMTPPPGVTGWHTAPFIGANGQFSIQAAVNFFALVFCLMVGTAALPHILIRYYTVKDQASARKSTVVGIGSIGFFYILTLFLGLGAMTSGAIDVPASCTLLGVMVMRRCRLRAA